MGGLILRVGFVWAKKSESLEIGEKNNLG